ncbi:N-6 DNA methylase [Lactobacillus hominis]|uniref:site-specific DNA-methyltransferase (adenine-specific) n=1 Tax=Lactobacillus hominis DSM 23910 = CRBIP 24.179 TaxID=1423758 RepID=I7KG68_9LACO|nr:N-6 DNA methylase [Lactobacillus hominis]KRM86058.1 type I site-specific deoxyribonuclease [Lactobacillus hominis DSM 23910 = CRBIP 24.179]MCT3348713.1 SAM-dependent DNA methyltransferase [Lactobacillus hominis]CCI80985.1 Type I restriction-modification system methyltransferase subunit [Lactobacillus hominis DSM 23910 = CRBIP 24.179]
MINGELKSKIDSLWDTFAAGGLTNPLNVIEQITYLMFIKDLDDLDNKKKKDNLLLGLNDYKSIYDGEVQVDDDLVVNGDELRWSTFKDFAPDKMFTVVQIEVFPFIKNLKNGEDSSFARHMKDATFLIPTPGLLSKVVEALDEIYRLMDADVSKRADIRGDVYEYLLGKLSTAGRNGQFRTPRHIIKMMVELMDPRADDKIADPAAGTAGFLVEAAEYLQTKKKDEIFYTKENKHYFNNEMFTGYDTDQTMLRIGAMNMLTHGVDNPNIDYHDSLSDQNTDKDEYSLILANPPFKGSLDYDTVSNDLLKVCKTKKTELLFLTLFLRMLRVGGRCACIVPDGVLFGSSKAHKSIRKVLVEDNNLEAVISMPSGVFKPYAGVSTAILIFTKTGNGGTDKVWFYDMTADGFSLDDKRTPVKENDIPDIIERFKHLDKEIDRKKTEKSFMVDKKDIVDNDYDLSINRYKEIEYKPVEYPPTKDIIAEIEKLDKEANDALQELKALLKD